MIYKSTSVLLISMLLGVSAPQGDWSLEKDESGVKIYTRSLDWTKHKEYKGEVFIRTTPDKLVAALKDINTYPNWMHNTYGAYVVRATGNEFLHYFVNDAPWPVNDRDIITKFVVNQVNAKTIRVDMTAAPKEVPEKNGMVRIPFMQGFWLFEDLGNGSCKVTQQVVSDPGGAIPAWLANSAIIDTPYNILSKLRKFLEGK